MVILTKDIIFMESPTAMDSIFGLIMLIIREIFIRVWEKDKAFGLTSLEIFTKEILKMTTNKVLELLLGLMGIFTKETSFKIWEMGKGKWFGMMEALMRVNGVKDCLMEKVLKNINLGLYKAKG